jgi:enoyl-CoA hydratase/carnithine racemase
MPFQLRPWKLLGGSLQLPHRARLLSSMTTQAYIEPIAEGIAAISLNRPQAKNAISVQLLSELRASIDAASNDPSYGIANGLLSSSETKVCAVGSP